jgi:hypothetical protein
MGDILSLTKKIDRAMMNRTGFAVTREELDAMIEDDLVDAFYAAKLRKLKTLCPAKQARSSSETYGSTSVETASRRSSGRSPDTTAHLDLSSIAALGRRN